jgi:hypothetical protein
MRSALSHQVVVRPDVDAAFGPGTTGFRDTYAYDPAISQWCVAKFVDPGDGSPVSGVDPLDCLAQPAP